MMSFQPDSAADQSIHSSRMGLRDAEPLRDAFDAVPDRHGVFAWWPDESRDWIHPHDLALARDFIPSARVWQRFRGPDRYDLYCYGPIHFRAEPRMWISVELEGYWLGDWVEVLSDGGRRRALLGQIDDIFWNRHGRRLEYSLTRQGKRLSRRFDASMFRACRSLTHWEAREVRRDVPHTVPQSLGTPAPRLDRSVAEATPWASASGSKLRRQTPS